VVFDFYYGGKIIPGVHLGAINLGGKTIPEASKILEYTLKVSSPSASILLGDKKFEVSPNDFDFTYQTQATLEKAMLVGREGNPIEMVREEVNSLRQGTAISPVISYNDEKLNAVLDGLINKVAKSAVDSKFVYANDNLSIFPEEQGQTISKEALKTTLISNWTRFDFGNIEVPLISQNPVITRTLLEKKLDEVKKRLSTLPSLSAGEKSFTLQPAAALSFFDWQVQKDIVTLTYKQAVIETYLGGLAREVNTNSHGEVFKVDENKKVVDFKPSQTGYELQLAESAIVLGTALTQASLPTTVNLIVKKTVPPSSSNDFGIRELLGEGTSNFAGSIPGRIHNLDLASSKINGVLITPGEEVSFNHLVGEVTAEAGYDEAYIISEGRTVLGTGGGLCQVSTTLFRATLNAGLPIVSRTAHAYRVHYYEPPVGLDATVYTPSVDLIFKNNTPKYLLIQREIDIPNNNLAFRIYGTSDGRKTVLDGPKILSETPPPPPLYQDDPTLAKGVVNQVDWSAWGANVTFYRKVTRGSEVLEDDTFVSNYTPWRAVYMVGTKE